MKRIALSDAILSRMCVSAGYIEDYRLPEEVVAAAKPVGRAPYRGAERKLSKPPKYAYKIFTLPYGPMAADGLIYAEWENEPLDYAAYDPKTASLWISFRGQQMHRWYWYQDVPPETWAKFKRLKKNAIVFFNKTIRPVHDYALVENPKQ